LQYLSKQEYYKKIRQGPGIFRWVCARHSLLNFQLNFIRNFDAIKRKHSIIIKKYTQQKFFIRFFFEFVFEFELNSQIPFPSSRDNVLPFDLLPSDPHTSTVGMEPYSALTLMKFRPFFRNQKLDKLFMTSITLPVFSFIDKVP
jgi:hypothetical protein